MKKGQQDLLLLPNYFNKIGLALLLISIVSFIVFLSFSIEVEVTREISKNGIFLALMFLMFSKGKVEDELTIKLRLQSFAAAFIYGVAMVVINPYTNLFFDETFLLEKGIEELILGMIFFYFITFYFLKRKHSEK